MDALNLRSDNNNWRIYWSRIVIHMAEVDVDPARKPTLSRVSLIRSPCR